MKRNEIFKQIIRNEMPDIEQIRTHCHNQAANEISAENATPKKTRRPYQYIGSVTLVALLITLTSITVLAAVFPGILQIGRSFWNNGTVVSEVGTHSISEEFRNYINTTEWTLLSENSPAGYSGTKNRLEFSTLDEVAVFFNVQFPKNTMLTNFTNFNGFEYDNMDIYNRANITSHILYNEKKDEALVYLFANHILDNGKIVIIYYGFNFGGSNNEPVNFSYSVGWTGIDEESGDVQSYTSPINGIEAILFKNDSEFRTTSYALFSLNNISYYLNTFSIPVSLTDENNSYNILKEIINAFE
jgi:hypothetical protein